MKPNCLPVHDATFSYHHVFQQDPKIPSTVPHTLHKFQLYLGDESGLAKLLTLPYGKRLFLSRDTAVGRREERQTTGSTCSPQDMVN